MAPTDHPAPGLLRKFQAIAEFAADLRSKLAKHVEDDVGALGVVLADINHHSQIISSLPQPTTGISHKLMKELEAQGRNLWNLSARLKRDETDASGPKEKSKLLVRARLLGFQLLELGRGARRQNRDVESDALYLINLAMTLGRICLGEPDVDLEAARYILQKMAEYVERLKLIPGASPDAESEVVRRKFEAEYLAMRTALSWKEGRLDVAEHMFSKADTLRQTLDVPSAEIIADTLQHIGSDLAAKGDSSMAIKWLRRAYEIINHQELDRLSAHGIELRLVICQTLFRSLLDDGSPENVQEAGDLIAYMETEIGDLPVVLHWQLELLQKTPGEVFDVDAYVSLLRRMIRSFDFSDGTFHFLLHHIKRLREKSSRLACGLLDELLQRHVLQSTKTDWLDKIVVWRVWLSTTETGSAGEPAHAPADIKGFLDTIQDSHPGPLRPDIAAAVHSLVWKKMQALFLERNHGVIEAWCHVALHEILSGSGEAYLEVFHRKLIICAIGLNDAEKARNAFQSMSEAAQNHILTRYLMFRVSLFSWDHELGCACIEHLSKSADKKQSRDFLYTCIQEAQQAGDKLCALAALRAVAESLAGGEAPGGNLPSVLRCAIHLMNSIGEQDDEATDTEAHERRFANDFTGMFEHAAHHARIDVRNVDGNRTFTVKELDWFRKTAYNFGVKKLDYWEPRLQIRLFNTCLAFNDCYPKDMPLSDVSERALMAMRCHFVIAVALVATARTNDAVDEQLQGYLEARRHIGEFDSLLASEVDNQEESVIKDLLAKLSTLSVFDFEAAVCLKSWDALNVIVRKAKVCRDEVMYKAMGDCLLRSKAPGTVIFATMRLIINEVYELEEFDHERLAKYVRCVFQAILPLDDGSAVQLFDQALQIAQMDSTDGGGLPSTEIEWLVAAAFNHAIEFYSRGEEEPCHRWALKAMELANYVGDGGGLRIALETKFAKLRFQDLGGGKM